MKKIGKNFHTIRCSKNEVPLGWTPARNSKNEALYRCGKIQLHDESGELRRCSDTTRKSRIQQHIEKGIHHFDIPQSEDPGFPKKIKDNKNIKTIEDLNRKVIHSTAKLIANIDISAVKGSGKSMKEHNINMLELGFEIGRIFSESVDFNEILMDFDDNTVSQIIVENGKEIYEKQIEEYSAIRYGNIVADAGTVNGFKCIHVLFTNPSYRKFIILPIYENQNYNKDQYQQLFLESISLLKQANLEVCSIITDNLRAQVSGIKSLIENSRDPYIASITHVKCYCHLLNLVFTDTMKLPWFKEIIEEIITFSNSLRDEMALKVVGRKCPTVVRTRWFYVVDVLKYIFDNENEIKSLLTIRNNSETHIPDIFYDVYRVLLPIKIFILALEKRDCALWMIIPIFRNITKLLFESQKSLITEDGKEIFNQITAYLYARMKKNITSDEVTAYALSNYGRLELREKYKGLLVQTSSINYVTTGLIDICEIYQNFTKYSNLSETTENESILEHIESSTTPDQVINSPNPSAKKYIQNATASEKRIQLKIDEMVKRKESEEELRFPINHVDVDNEQSDIEDEDSDTLTYNEDDDAEALSESLSLKEEYEKQLNMTIVERIEQDIFVQGNNTLYNIARENLIQKGRNYNLSEDYIIEQFDAFLFNQLYNTDSISYCYKYPPNQMWREMVKYTENIMDFAKLALHFITMGVSEADAERIISIQKDVMGRKSTKMGTEVLTARLRMHTSKQS